MSQLGHVIRARSLLIHVPENNWIDGVYDMIQSLKKTAIKLELLQVIHEKGIAIS